jgi:hypothetical protein
VPSVVSAQVGQKLKSENNPMGAAVMAADEKCQKSQ